MRFRWTAIRSILSPTGYCQYPQINGPLVLAGRWNTCEGLPDAVWCPFQQKGKRHARHTMLRRDVLHRGIHVCLLAVVKTEIAKTTFC